MSIDFNALIIFHNQRSSRELASRAMSIVVLETAVVAIVALWALCGNMLACVAIVRNARLHTPTNKLIFVLAVTDITMLLSTMPLTVGVLGTLYFQQRSLPISRFLSFDTDCYLSTADGCRRQLSDTCVS